LQRINFRDMKFINLVAAIFIFTSGVALAQDSLLIYKSGSVVTKRAISDIDSIVFSKDPTVAATVTDIDGNVYHTIKIGTQVWMVENLKTTRLNDGSSISNVNDGNTWFNLSSPAYCWYNNLATYKNIYGALYNWYCVNTGKLAPVGWHIPSDSEWAELTNFLINHGFGYGGAGSDIGKSLAFTSGWSYSSTVGYIGNEQSGNNSSGFAGLPGGYRYDTGAFNNVGGDAYWWSSTEANTVGAWSRTLYYSGSDATSYIGGWRYGFSVRCIKD